MKGTKSLVAGIALLFILIPSLEAQKALGQWSTHLPYGRCMKVVKTENKVYCSALGGLFYYDLLDNSLNTVSKIDSLSDNGVSAMNYNPDRKLLILAYENANLDLITDNGITNIPDIMKKQIPGDKSVYDIFFFDNLAYLSCGFGIVVLNLDRLEIKDTYFIGDQGTSLKVNQTTSDGEFLYAATDKGVRKAPVDDPFLIDYNTWERLEDIPESNQAFGEIAWFNGTLFAGYSDPAGLQDRVLVSSGSGWSDFSGFTGTACNEMKISGNFLILVEDSKTDLISENMLVIRQFYTKKPLSADIDSDLNFWIADYGEGLVHEEDDSPQSYTPNGPYSSNVFDMVSSNGDLYAVGGGITTLWNNLFRMAQLFTFTQNYWKSSYTSEYRDLIAVVADPLEKGHLYAASWGYGLLEFRDNEIVNVFNEFNSSLQNIITGENYVRVGGLARDKQGNIWMTNTGVSEPISVLKTDGTWKSFKADNLISDFP
ncbi:MAG: hypothetical protein ACOYXB_07740, partial [Bacteroidota bacterium]